MNSENNNEIKELLEEVTVEKKQVPYTFTGNQIIFSYEGKTQIISNTHAKYSKLMELMKTKKFDKDSISEAMGFIAKKNLIAGYDIVNNNVVKVNDKGEVIKELPLELSKKLMEYAENDLPLSSLIAFWEKLELNPSFRSIEMLYTFLIQNKHPIFEDGCFLAYRSVTSDFKDHHTKTMDNSIGQVLTMPRNEVDDDPKSTCSKGLHVASHSYAAGFGSDRLLVEVKVDPQHVVCVPYDYNNTKMRVCQFEVIGICKDERDEVVYGKEKNAIIIEKNEEQVRSQKFLEEIQKAKDELFDDFGDNHEMLVNAISEETGYEIAIVEQALDQLNEMDQKEELEDECEECGCLESHCECCDACQLVNCECDFINDVVESAGKYKDKFSGKYLVNMVARDTGEDAIDIESILKQKGLI